MSRASKACRRNVRFSFCAHSMHSVHKATWQYHSQQHMVMNIIHSISSNQHAITSYMEIRFHRQAMLTNSKSPIQTIKSAVNWELKKQITTTTFPILAITNCIIKIISSDFFKCFTSFLTHCHVFNNNLAT